jgi:hypothetical protein
LHQLAARPIHVADRGTRHLEAFLQAFQLLLLVCQDFAFAQQLRLELRQRGVQFR